MRASEIAERALLGAILLDPARLADLQQWLEPADFYAYRHGLVYTEMLDLRRTGQAPTARAVLDRVIPSADLRRHVDGPYLHTLMESCPHPSRAPIYGRMVLEASIHRRTAERAEHLGYIAQSEAPADVIEEIGRQVEDWSKAIQGLEERWTLASGDASLTDDLDLRAPDVQRSPIADEAAEVSLIASVLASPWQFDHLKNWLRAEDFARPDMRALYAAITAVVEAAQPIDAVTVMGAALRDAGATDSLSHEAVARLAVAGISGYAVVCGRAVLQAGLRREAASSACRLASAAQQPRARPAEVTRYARERLAELAASCRRSAPA